MGNPWFGSKAASGLWQALVALMPPHAVCIETHLGGGAVMRRKPGALRNIGIDLDRRALSSFECGYPVELVHGDCHAYLEGFPFDGSELVYSDPPYRACKDFCVSEPYHELFERRKVWQRSTTTASRVSCWMN